MRVKIFGISNGADWNRFLGYFNSGPCVRFEYVCAYAAFEGAGEPTMFAVENAGKRFAYVFLTYHSNHVDQTSRESFSIVDIASPYGYSGALTTSLDSLFIAECWRLFDSWTTQQRVVCEFFRGPPVDTFPLLVHPQMMLTDNRDIAFIDCNMTDDEYCSVIKQKQRNMVRRAIKEGCEAVEYRLEDALPWFDPWYREAMNRSSADPRFYYSASYYSKLAAMGGDVTVICIVKDGVKLSAAIMIFGTLYSLYHLAATNPESRINYATPFLIYCCRQACARRNQKPLILGGGRTTAEDDSLFRFKQSVSTNISKYRVGTRVLNPSSYSKLMKIYLPSDDRVIFYR